ncbi:DUF2156 domain-containing protein [Treponema pedis]|uniref:DUF2156 domain-containing protein n=1 Tax=Treponema pedis TaxID=409322 RepID=UPI0004286104|nr:phosphatidylglycerol lysyltransferase domain-containing protein [Treponema pedis]QSI04168.1 DUF2156 domain-containing protein [Treponema pedis]
MNIPEYPEFARISVDMQNEIEFYLRKLPDGISELTFMNLYLFRETYKYRISKTEKLLIITGEYKGEPFFITPCCTVNVEITKELLEKYKNWTILSKSFLDNNRTVFELPYFKNLKIEEDRDNFDYIYLRKNLAELAGKDFHKKKTHINKFEKTYENIRIEPLTLENIDDARKILEIWAESLTDKTPENSDYYAALDALDIFPRSAMPGIVLYVWNEPVAWTIAEITQNNKTAVILFEKADASYKGSFQYINYAFARYLPEYIEFINREQDLGDEGLRQAKMTYRPVKFIKKYKITNT